MKNLITAICVFGLAACVGTINDPGNGEDGDDDDDVVVTPDAAPADPPDAAPPPDAEPVPLAYPSGPYGTREGDIIMNLSWQGYADDDGDGDPYNDAPREIFLEEYFIGRDPGAKILLITSSAGWCGPCQDEASVLPGIWDDFYAGGGRMLTAMFETTSGASAGIDFAKSWGQSFDLPFTTVADPSDKVGPYYESNVIPMNMFINLETMEIIEVHHGFSSSSTREIFNAYVD